MKRTVFALTKETGFFSTFFRICTMYLANGSQIMLNTEKWHHGRWSWYFTSLTDTSNRPDYVVTDTPAMVEQWTLGDYRRVLRELYTLTPLLRQKVQSVRNRIGKPYIGLFVRRGDKLVSEAKYIPMSTILSYIPYKSDTVFFVQTDDYGVIEEMRNVLPNHVIYHTVPTTKRGSYHSSHYTQSVSVPWSNKSLEDARAETEEMLVGLSVCLAADQCWTDDTSNVGRFLKLYDDRVHVYPNDYSVDETFHAHPAWSIHT